MIRCAVVLLCLATLAASAPWWPYWGYPFGGYYGGHYNPYWWQGYHHYPASKLVFYGTFLGTCDHHPDGIYYVDERSFAYCSNGQKTIQPCADGAANPPLAHFEAGKHYGFYDFCSVNLVAHGYAPPAAPNYAVPVKTHTYEKTEVKDGY